MSIQSLTPDLDTYCDTVSRQARSASRQLVGFPTETKNRWLEESALRLERMTDEILQANEKDLKCSDELELTNAEKDRLRLSEERVSQMARGLRDIARLPDPVGERLEQSVRPNGLQIEKVRVPLGVIFFIYESRPNVTVDAAAIAVKSGNAIILRGGKEAFRSSQCLVGHLRDVAMEVGIPVDAVQFVETTDRDAVGKFLKRSEDIDLVIPRGGEGLIRRVVAEATMPVLKHYDGNCHVYVDAVADIEKAIQIVENAKCQRMGVCNAMESLLVHQSIAESFFAGLVPRLVPYGIEYRADKLALAFLSNATMSTLATEADWFREYLGPMMSVRIVDSLDDAIQHINRYGSHHTDAIVTEDSSNAKRFAMEVDSAAVMINASTRFHDGGELGMGAEIGISTDKFHARGPCGLKELTTYKYVVRGNGQIRT